MSREEVLAKRSAVCRAANVSSEALLSPADEPPAKGRGGGGGGGGGGAGLPMDGGVAASPRFGHRHYPLALAWLDSGVGEVLDALRAYDVYQNTITVRKIGSITSG